MIFLLLEKKNMFTTSIYHIQKWYGLVLYCRLIFIWSKDELRRSEEEGTVSVAKNSSVVQSHRTLLTFNVELRNLAVRSYQGIYFGPF